jgi:hypothetical protein
MAATDGLNVRKNKEKKARVHFAAVLSLSF